MPSLNRIIRTNGSLTKVIDGTQDIQIGTPAMMLVNQAGRPIHPPGDGFRIREFFKNTLGSRDQHINTLAVEQEFFIAPPAGQVWEIDLLKINVIDSSSNGFDYGGFGGGLVNGIKIELRHGDIAAGTLIMDLLAGYVIKNNVDWSTHAFEARADDYGAIKSFNYIYKYSDILRSPLRLLGPRDAWPLGQRISIRLHDNLTGRPNFRQWAKVAGSGYYE